MPGDEQDLSSQLQAADEDQNQAEKTLGRPCRAQIGVHERHCRERLGKARLEGGVHKGPLQHCIGQLLVEVCPQEGKRKRNEP